MWSLKTISLCLSFKAIASSWWRKWIINMRVQRVLCPRHQGGLQGSQVGVQRTWTVCVRRLLMLVRFDAGFIELLVFRGPRVLNLLLPETPILLTSLNYMYVVCLLYACYLVQILMIWLLWTLWTWLVFKVCLVFKCVTSHFDVLNEWRMVDLDSKIS